MLLKIAHTTTYTYDAPVSYALQRIRLRPAPSVLQNVLSWTLSVTGGNVAGSHKDHYGNHVDLICAEEGTQQLAIHVSGEVETQDKAGVLGPVYGRAPLWHFCRETPMTKPGKMVNELAGSVDVSDDRLGALHALSVAVLSAVKYELATTDPQTTAEEAVAQGRGVCQDHANIFLGAARAADIPARYVSGYLMMNDRVEQDATHAWAEAHIDGLGWVGFDIANGISPDPRYVRVATGRDYRDAAPVTGISFGQAEQLLTVNVEVEAQGGPSQNHSQGTGQKQQ